MLTLGKEINLLKKAIITKPQDQSLWFYHRWLIHSNASPSVSHLDEVIAPKMPRSIKIALVISEIEDLTDLLMTGDSDTKKKWVIAALVGLVGLLRRLRRRSKSISGEETKGNEEGDKSEEEDEEEEGEEEEDEVDEEAEMSRVREWVGRLIVIEGERGKGRRWIDLGGSQSSRPLLHPTLGLDWGLTQLVYREAT